MDFRIGTRGVGFRLARLRHSETHESMIPKHKAYAAANAVAFRKYGARILTRGARSETVDGRIRSRVVVIEFRDFEAALACYQSPEYEEVMAQTQGISPDIRVVEGYD